MKTYALFMIAALPWKSSETLYWHEEYHASYHFSTDTIGTSLLLVDERNEKTIETKIAKYFCELHDVILNLESLYSPTCDNL